MNMIKTYDVKDTFEIADRGSHEITEFLKKYDYTIEVVNVENDKDYQKKDIDLIWRYKLNGKVHEKYIEIKADRYISKNLAIETISNKEYGTLGCFLYTEADYIFYYFMQTKEIYIIDIKKVRPWFQRNEHKFKEINTKTYIGSNRNKSYTTVCRLVPKEKLIKQFPNMKVINLNTYEFANNSIFEEILEESKSDLKTNIQNLPQANDFKKMISVLEYINRCEEISNMDVRKKFKWSRREANYYLQALEQLDLIQCIKNEDKHTYKSNEHIQSLMTEKEKEVLLCKFIMKNPVCHWVIDTYKTSKNIPNSHSILEYIHNNFNFNLSDNTLNRRITCLLNWSNWAIQTLTSKYA